MTPQLLQTAIDKLGYADADERFLTTTNKTKDVAPEQWLECGDWLALGRSVGVEKIFFIENNPVAIFAQHATDDDLALRDFMHHIWSMARPRFLFLERSGELAVYDLAQKPPNFDDNGKFKPKALATARTILEVAERLKRYRREELELGTVFESKRTDALQNRADKALIRDLKTVRKELIALGLGKNKLRFAHALIGRSIFIRYLEDRGVLTEVYFRKVAKNNRNWNACLDAEVGGLIESQDIFFPRVLQDHAFTYALFRQLAHDFNGDMFPNVDEEEETVQQKHLNKIIELMYGETGPQKSLFFYAYRFNAIPIELISSIYEEFYHKETGKGRANGAYYTPPALVEFVLSQAVTWERLEGRPRIVDPACGSGIFLVESFRRIVRYRMVKQKRRLRFEELRAILRDQIAGIDIEPEAIRVAAFSLYLALLSYMEPPDIL